MSEAFLSGLRRKRTGLLLRDPQSSFQMKAIFFILFGNKHLQVWRNNGDRIQGLLCPVWSFCSLWWFGVPCHLHTAIYQKILEHFLPSANKLHGNANFLFQQDFECAHSAKTPTKWSAECVIMVVDGAADSPDLKPTENLWFVVKRKMRSRPKNTNELLSSKQPELQ